jgi:hypothetical protein
MPLATILMTFVCIWLSSIVASLTYRRRPLAVSASKVLALRLCTSWCRRPQPGRHAWFTRHPRATAGGARTKGALAPLERGSSKLWPLCGAGTVLPGGLT